MSEQKSPERPVDESLPQPQKPWLGPCMICATQVDRAGASLCDDCDDRLHEELAR